MSRVGFNRPKLILSMCVFGPRNSAYAFWHTADIQTDDIYMLLYHGKSRLNTQVWGSLCSPNYSYKFFSSLQGERAHSLYFWSFQKQNREEGETEQKQQIYQFTQGYNILHRLQVHHLTLTFIIHNNEHYIYIHTHIYELL